MKKLAERKENHKDKNEQQNHAKYSHSIPIVVCMGLLVIIGRGLLLSSITVMNRKVWEDGFALAVRVNEFSVKRRILQADSIGQCHVHSEAMTSKQCSAVQCSSTSHLSLALSLLHDEFVNLVVDA